ncbi:hypothetical protein TNCV_3495151 [Trichonephila clavipes]|nr:hypothetical protein TNCV_3495151 [Trichonephila clavipes]
MSYGSIRRCCALSAASRQRNFAASTVSVSLRRHVSRLLKKRSLGLLSQQPVEMLDTQHAVDADHGTVLVSHQFVEMTDIERSVDAELETALVSQQLCKLPHAPPV